MEENIYFKPGNIVQLKLNIPNKPLMLVVKKENNFFKNAEGKNTLQGIRCRWFTTTGLLLETIWNTKDLILIK